MKHTWLIPLACCLVPLTLPASLLAETGTVIANSVFIREAPNKASRIVGSFVKGDTVEFSPLPASPGWVRVKGAGREGVMIRKALALNTKSPVPDVAANTETVVAPVSADVASEREAAVRPLKVIEVTPEMTDEELRLTRENERLSGQIKNLLPLKEEIAGLRRELARKNEEIGRKDAEMARMKKLVPSLDLALKVEEQGEEIKLSDVGYAKMLTIDKEVVFQVGTQNVEAADRVVGRSARKKLYLGSSVYYVLDKQAVKTANH